MHSVGKQRRRRIAVVFGADADGGVSSVLASLASKRGAEVSGVFVEDRGLFRTAELPFATEVCRITTVRRPLTTTQLERQMRVLARRAESALRHVAERAGSTWSFRRHRGRLGTALAEVSDIDLVVVGTARETLVSIGELRATARTVRAAEGDARRPVVVLFERSDPGGRALEAGVELAEGSGRRLIVFLPGAIDEVPPELDERLQSLGRERVSIRRALSAEPTELRSAVRAVSPAVLVLGADEAGFGEDQVRVLQRDVRCPLVVVR